MLRSSVSSLQTGSDNKFPDCLTLSLAAIPVETTAEFPALQLQLSAQLGEQWLPLLAGQIKVGLTGGSLQLNLENGHWQNVVSETAFPHNTVALISLLGSPSQPSWRFSPPLGLATLQGTIAEFPLATIAIETPPCRLEAIFQVMPQDVHLTDAEGLWRHTITPNQHAVLERRIVFSILTTQLMPYLSWTQICYDCATACLPPPISPDPSRIQEEERSLQALIEQIGQVTTDNFLELSQFLGLQPHRDFAGGNLRGTRLNGLDLSGAILSQANLRGADLSDADLCEANLSRSKLSGADLGGAYLGDANLYQADLHRASLALANLSGANLNGANLQEANLSGTNFSGAQLQGTQFGQNPGLTEDLKRSLQERGAIFNEALPS